ncbi:hypothetical protein V866_004752 [Kwoniella sp. B9012]
MSLTSPHPPARPLAPQRSPSLSPEKELPAPRKTSSPLSSPSSMARGNDLPIDPDADLDAAPEIRSPATSSTLPLTDDEEEEEQLDEGDEDSELTEEEEEEEEEEEGVKLDNRTGTIRRSISSESRSHREDSQASTASLTPPPSDKSITPSPQPSPKITLKLNAPRAEDSQDEVNADDNEQEEEEDGDVEDEDDEDGDVTMRAQPTNVDESDSALEQSKDLPNETVGEEETEDISLNDSKASVQDESTSTEGQPPAEEEEEELEEEKEMGDKIVIDEDEVDVEPPVEIEVEVEKPQDGEEGEENENLAGEEEGEPIDQDAEDEQEHEDVEENDHDHEAADSPAYLTVPTHGKSSHSTHAPPPTTAAMRSLVLLELKFAALRDRLYIERMEEAAAEEEMILNGTHPALKYLYKTLSDRRERLHEVASRRHQQTLGELKRVREAEKHLIWSSWTEDRDRLHWDEFEHTWSKRRRLAREKNEIETPRIVKPVPKVGQPSTIRAFDWSAGATPSQLSMEEGNHDLALMDQHNRRQLQTTRNASPAIFAPQYNVAGSSSQPVNGGTTIYSYPQTQQQSHESHQPRHNPTPALPQQQSQAAHTNYPPRVANTSNANAKSYQPPQPSASTQQNQNQPVQRREGRTVPTTSDLFAGPRRDSSVQKVKSPGEEPMSPIGLWSRGINGNTKRDGSSPKTPSSLGTPTISHNLPPGNSLASSNVGIRPGSAGAGSGPDKKSPHISSVNESGPIRSNSTGSTQHRPNTGGTASTIPAQPPRSNSNPTSLSSTTISANDRPGSGIPPNAQARERPDFPSRFASLADYLASSTGQPGNGLFGMGIGLGSMGLGVPMGVGKGVGGMGVGQNKARSPFQTSNGNSSPFGTTQSGSLAAESNNTAKSTSPVPPPTLPPAGTVTTAGTGEGGGRS